MTRTSGVRQYVCFLTLVCGFGLLARGEAQEAGKGYEIHEWGVLAGCHADDKYFNTARPLKVLAVREPIVYVHSRDKKPFSLRVTFPNGKPTDTYPPAEVAGNAVSWTDVQFVQPGQQEARGFRPRDFLPLEKIMPVLNDVDADELIYGNQSSRFLFYEGETRYDNRIALTHDIAKKTVVIENRGAETVYDVFAVVPERGAGPFSVNVFVGRVPELKPGEKVSVNLRPFGKDDSFSPSLTALGFTQKEAASFDKLWLHPLFYPMNRPGWSHLIYRLGEEECNAVSELAFDPKPDRIVRALYVLVRFFDQQPGNARGPEAPARQGVVSDAELAIERALPDGWAVLRVEENAYPSYRPKGNGKAIFLGLKEKTYLKQQYSAALYLMPKDYDDGGPDPIGEEAQSGPARLIATTQDGKIYLWPGSQAEDWRTMQRDLLKALTE